MQRYAAKWSFSGCLFYQSNFKSLGMASMGIRMSNSAWIEGTFPERAAIGDDEAGMYRDRWNDVKNCLFFRAEVAPSAVWTTDQSNFVRCTVSGHSQFDSKTTLQVNLFTPEADPAPGGVACERAGVGQGGFAIYVHAQAVRRGGAADVLGAVAGGGDGGEREEGEAGKSG